ncbi:hypothetical protein BZA77DRAFT_356895 [Pyronema omphalodes]|nr:hypothetical protein BZA77DRAFT_356895 [Pyronema omphalodes]
MLVCLVSFVFAGRDRDVLLLRLRDLFHSHPGILWDTIKEAKYPGNDICRRPENGDSASMEVLVKFMRGTIEQLKDDEDTREFSCKAQEFWKNFRAAVKVAGEI